MCDEKDEISARVLCGFGQDVGVQLVTYEGGVEQAAGLVIAKGYR